VEGGSNVARKKRNKRQKREIIIPATLFALFQEGAVTVDFTVPAALDTLTSPVDKGDVLGLVQCPDVFLLNRCLGDVAAGEL
jgi:hypothetical protein